MAPFHTHFKTGILKNKNTNTVLYNLLENISEVFWNTYTWQMRVTAMIQQDLGGEAPQTKYRLGLSLSLILSWTRLSAVLILKNPSPVPSSVFLYHCFSRWKINLDYPCKILWMMLLRIIPSQEQVTQNLEEGWLQEERREKNMYGIRGHPHRTTLRVTSASLVFRQCSMFSFSFLVLVVLETTRPTLAQVSCWTSRPQ